MSIKKLAAVLLTVTVTWGPMSAPVAAQSPCVALIGARAYLPNGPQDEVTVVIQGDAIASVGVDELVPERCEKIDARGRVLTPGLVETFSNLGTLEINLESAVVDTGRAEHQTSPVRASFRVADAYNPRSVLIPTARVEGVTSAVTVPDGAVVAGQAAWVDLAGATQAETVKRSPSAMAVRLGAHSGSRADRLHVLSTLLSEARSFQRYRGQWEQNRRRPFLFPGIDLAAMKGVIDRVVPLLVRVDRASDIEALMRLAVAHEVRVIIVGGAEAWIHKAALAQAKIPVIVDPMLYGPESADQIHARADNVVQLHDAGVLVVIATMETHNARRLRQVAGNAVRAGLDHTVAIRAITQHPALAFGMARYGRIAAGAIANLVLWSGDPLEISTQVERLFIGGRTVSKDSRQRRLLERYRVLPGTPVPPPPALRKTPSGG